MRITFSQKGWSHYLFWQGEDPKVLARINALIAECTRHPFSGTGKPELLSGNLKGWWSRRITREHRLIHRVGGAGEAQALEVAACRYRY